MPLCPVRNYTTAVPVTQWSDVTPHDPQQTANRNTADDNELLITATPIPDPILRIHTCRPKQPHTLQTYVHCPNPTTPSSTASQNHYKPNPELTQTTFKEWCKTHISATKMIQWLINRGRMADIRALVQDHTTTVNLHSDKFPVTATTPHDDAEFERHHFQEHTIHVKNPYSNTTSTSSTSTQCTIAPDEEMMATYVLLPPTQLRRMSTIRRRHVRFQQYYCHMTQIPKICHFNSQDQRAKIGAAAHHTLSTRNIRSFIQYKPRYIGADTSAKNLLRPP